MRGREVRCRGDGASDVVQRPHRRRFCERLLCIAGPPQCIGGRQGGVRASPGGDTSERDQQHGCSSHRDPESAAARHCNVQRGIQCPQHVAGILVPASGFVRQTACDHRVDPRRQSRNHAAEPLWTLTRAAHQRLEGRSSSKRRLAAEHLEQNQTQRIDVGRGRDGSAADLFRGRCTWACRRQLLSRSHRPSVRRRDRGPDRSPSPRRGGPTSSRGA